MKKIMFIIGMLYIFSGCNSNDRKQADDTKTYNQSGIQNVNGNIPDTTNAIDLSTHKKDSTGMRADSIK
jgi:hypothetical protein